MASHPSIARRAHAASVLLAPLWLVGTATLVLNDHVWKGGTLLPDVVTGKLSDAAGMFVAPALLAAALGVRTLRGWWASHVAVGVVFAAIKLSASCAALWSAMMGGFGFAWTIVVDPTDLLVAMPALVLAERLLRPALTAAPATLARRSGEAAAAGVGLFCSVATSAPEQPLPEEFPEQFLDIDAQAWLHNGTEEEQVVRVRRIRDSVLVDCPTVATDPARLLDVAAFGDVESWTLPVDANMAVVDPYDTGSCTAVWIDVDGFDPLVLFWEAGDVPVQVVPGAGYEPAIRGGVDMLLDDDGNGRFEGDASIMFEPAEAAELTGACALQDDADRVDWNDGAPIGDWTIVAIEPGVDGCTAFDLAIPGETVASDRLYLCLPELDLPLVVGEDVSVSQSSSPDYFDGQITIEALAAPARSLTVSRGAYPPSVGGLLFEAGPIAGCEWTVDACGTVAQAAEVRVGAGIDTPITASVGKPEVVALADDAIATIVVAHAQRRAVVDPFCTAGSESLGIDLEVVVLIEAAQ